MIYPFGNLCCKRNLMNLEKYHLTFNIFVFLSISSVFNSCKNQDDYRLYPESIVNGKFDQWTDAGDPEGWTQNRLGPKLSTLNTADGQLQTILSGSWITRNAISQIVILDSNHFYVVTVNVEKYEGRENNLGVRIYDGNGTDLGFHILATSNLELPTNLSVKFKPNSRKVQIQVGYEKLGISNAIIGEVVLHPTDELQAVYSHDYANYLYDALELDPFDASNYHDNVLKLAKYVNRVLITPLNGYYHFDGEDIEAYLFMEERKRDSISNLISMQLPDSKFSDYIKLPIKEMSNSYCVKSSLSSEDLLITFHIPVRQIHFTDGTDAFHQCFEYWNPYLDKWVIVDPFYGITYVDNQGDLLSFHELKSMAANDQISRDNLKHVEIDEFYFQLEELSKGWNEGMFLGSKDILFKSYAH